MVVLFAIWVTIAILWGSTMAIVFLMERTDPSFDVEPRTWARLLLATPVWPIPALYLVWRLLSVAYRHATYQDGDDHG